MSANRSSKERINIIKMLSNYNVNCFNTEKSITIFFFSFEELMQKLKPEDKFIILFNLDLFRFLKDETKAEKHLVYPIRGNISL